MQTFKPIEKMNEFLTEHPHIHPIYILQLMSKHVCFVNVPTSSLASTKALMDLVSREFQTIL